MVKNHTKPEFPLDWHNQSIDAAQATDQVTASLADKNKGRLGHHEATAATVREPGGSSRLADDPTWEFNSSLWKTIIYII